MASPGNGRHNRCRLRQENGRHSIEFCDNPMIFSWAVLRYFTLGNFGNWPAVGIAHVEVERPSQIFDHWRISGGPAHQIPIPTESALRRTVIEFWQERLLDRVSGPCWAISPSPKVLSGESLVRQQTPTPSAPRLGFGFCGASHLVALLE